MLTIRFNRTGRKNRAHFRMVLQEHTIAPGGRHVEMLGSYDPHQKKAVLKSERIQYWLGQGVQVSDTVWNLLIKEGVTQDKKRAIKMKQPVKKEEVTAAESVNNAEVKNEEAETASESEPVKKEEPAEPAAEAETKNDEAAPEIVPAGEEVKPEEAAPAKPIAETAVENEKDPVEVKG